MSKPIDPTQHLRVVAGNPSAEELAVVVAVLQAAATSAKSATNHQPAAPTSTWHQNPNNLRAPINPGHRQWQASFLRGLN